MADESLQQKQRRRQKAVKDPVAASRVIKNSLYGTGWSGKLSVEEKQMATGFLDDAAAMCSLQINRDRDVSPPSLHNAIFWEHHQLSDQTIVSTPALTWEQHQVFNDQKIVTGIIYSVPFFSTDKETWKDAVQQVSKQGEGRSTTVEIHDLFRNIRDREFTIWPVLVDGFWVTIIMRVEPMETPEFQPGNSTNYYYDRKVSTLAVLDPVYEGREDRHTLVCRRLRHLLSHGAIQFTADSIISTLTCDQVAWQWETGYMSYAVSREFLRRLKVLIHRREREASGEPGSASERALLWAPIEESPRIDGYRESLVGACSNYVIESSGYRIRSALEVPSSAAGHSPEKLRPDNDDAPIADEKIDIGDQTRRFKLKMDLPEDFIRESSVEVSQDTQPSVDQASALDDTDVDKEDEDGNGSSSDSDSSIDEDVAPAQEVSQEPHPSSPVEDVGEPEDPKTSEEPASEENPTIENQPEATESDPRNEGTGSKPSSPSNETRAEPEGSAEEKRLKEVATAAQDLSQVLEGWKRVEEEDISDAPPSPLEINTAPPPASAWSSNWSFHDTAADNSGSEAKRVRSKTLSPSKPSHQEGSTHEDTVTDVNTDETIGDAPKALEGPEPDRRTEGEGIREEEGEAPQSPVLEQDSAIEVPATQTEEVETRDGPTENEGRIPESNPEIPETPIAAPEIPEGDGNPVEPDDKEHISIFGGQGPGNNSPGSDSDAFISEDVAEEYIVPKDDDDDVEKETAALGEAPTPAADTEPEESTRPSEREELPTIQEETPVAGSQSPLPPISSVIPGLSYATPPAAEKREREEDATDLPSPKRPKENTPDPTADS